MKLVISVMYACWGWSLKYKHILWHLAELCVYMPGSISS